MPRTHGSALFTRGQTQALTLLTLGARATPSASTAIGLGRLQALSASLQLPAILGGRDRVHARAQAPRHRPRCARRARPVADGAGREGLPVHDPSGLGDPREQRLFLDGERLRLHAVADGRRRADQGARGRHRHGSDQGGRRLRRALRHRRRRGPPRRHGLQGRRHRATASPPCRWTSRSAASRFEILADALEQARRGRLFILDKMLATLPEPRAELSPYAPRIFTIQINPDQIGLVIGKGGETIRGICEEFGVQHRHRGRRHHLRRRPRHGGTAEAVIERITAMTKDIEVGDIIHRQGGQDDRLRRLRRTQEGRRRPHPHLASSASGSRRSKVEDVVNRGDTITVEVVEIDKARNRIGLQPLKRPAATLVAGGRLWRASRIATLDNGLRVVTEPIAGRAVDRPRRVDRGRVPWRGPGHVPASRT